MKTWSSLLVLGLASCTQQVELGTVEPAAAVLVPPPSTSPLSVPHVVQLAPWEEGMCGLFDDHQVRCWGHKAPQNVWTVKGLTGVAFAAAENDGDKGGRICAISAAGAVACVAVEYVWSDDSVDCVLSDPPHDVNVVPSVVSISLDRAGGAALRADGTFQAWGEAVPSCIDPPPSTPWEPVPPNEFSYDVVTAPAALSRPIVALDHGGQNVCLVTDDGYVQCTAMPLDYSVPTCAWPPAFVREPDGKTYVEDATAVTVSLGLVCILHRTGHVTCYGETSQLGVGSTNYDFWAAEVKTIDDAVTVVGNGGATCAIRSDGSLWCWGVNLEGNLGPGPNIPDSDEPDEFGDSYNTDAIVTLPRRIDGVTDVRTVGMGNGYTCAGEADGDVWCWGWPTGGTPYRIVVPPAP